MRKIYLEPRKRFDSCLVRECEQFSVYSVNRILEALVEEWGVVFNEEIRLEALDYFYYNVESLQVTGGIVFDYDA